MTSAHGDPRVDGSYGEDEPPVVVRDRRRIDPDSGEVRPEAAAAASGGRPDVPPPSDGDGSEAVDALRKQVDERTADLQRLKAEYDNYRRRVERDRQQASDQATARVLAGLLPTLDDIGRARDHGDLEGPFKAVAETLESTLEAAGLERFGSAGDEFDPLIHDALLHAYSADVTRPTCVEVFRSGYRHASRVLRPAQVSVAEPAPAETLDAPTHEPPSAAAPQPDDTGSYPGRGSDQSIRAE